MGGISKLSKLGKGIESLIPNVEKWYPKKIVCPSCGDIEIGDDMFPRPVEDSVVCRSCVEGAKISTFQKKVKLEIPPKHRHCLKEEAPDLKSGIFWGSYGVGKTHAMWGMVKKYGEKDYIKTSEYRMSSDLKAGYSDNTHDLRVDRYKKIGFLAIDEYGKVKDTDNHRAMMFDILDYRYEHELLTVIAVNCASSEDLDLIITPDIRDRFRSNVLQFKGDSKR